MLNKNGLTFIEIIIFVVLLTVPLTFISVKNQKQRYSECLTENTTDGKINYFQVNECVKYKRYN